MSGSSGIDQSAGGEEPHRDAAALEDRRQALERLAERVRSGELDVISPEELAELRRQRWAE